MVGSTTIANIIVNDRNSGVGHIGIYAASDSFVMDRLRLALNTVEPDLQGPSELATLASLRAQLQARQQAESTT